DENGLRIFGEEPVGNEPELILHSSISNRWKKYLSDGLKKEVKDSLLDKYPRKGKLSFEPPILNEEVTVNLKDSALKRDKYFCLTQKLAGSALSALAPVIESLVPSKEPENVGRLEKVWDAAKLLIEIHRSQTVARKACILPTLSKQWATALEKRTTDSYLFGEKLVDKVKEIKAIGKVGDEMKPSLPKKIFAPPNPLNWKSSSSQKKPVSQASGKISIPKKPPTSKFQSKQSTYPKVSIFAGRLRYFLKAWKSITSDEFVIQCVKGYKIPFKSIPVQNCLPPTRLWSKQEVINIQSEINRLLSIGAIVEVEEVSDQFISPFFLVPKSDGQQRFILILKELNTFIDTEHFKLEDLRSACNLLEHGIFMGTIDLKDAYFLIPVCEIHRKFLRFTFNGKIYEFICLPFGLCTCPLTFTKLLKPVINYLRLKGFLSIVYLDDFLCLGDSIEECSENLWQTIKLLESLGFIVNFEKSNLEPGTRCKYLGFILNSFAMRVELPQDKKISMQLQIENLKKKKTIKIRDFAKVVGSIVACCPAVEYSLLHCRLFERAKVQALSKSGGCFEASMEIPRFTLEDWDWWLKVLPNASKKIRNSCLILALKYFVTELRGINILLMVDNTTTMAYINRMGGVRYSDLHKLACEFWNWCESRQLWVHATYIPSKENVEADYSSRIDN
ncbi:GSCOCG00003625001-RA-CDS, partial [Cotesia congregata]